MSTTGFPLVRYTLAFDFTPQVLMDLHTYWLQQTLGQLGMLGSDIDASATTLILTSPAGYSSGTGPVIGDAITIDDEPMILTGIQETSLTVVRYTDAFPNEAQNMPIQPTKTHTANTPVIWLRFRSGAEMVQDLWVRPGTIAAIQSLAKKSLTLYSSVTGSIGLPTP